MSNVSATRINIEKVLPSLGQENLQKVRLAGILERVCQGIELSKSQYLKAKAHYEAVGEWLAGSTNPNINDAEIYPQGSISIDTTVRPIVYNEFDVDLVCHAPSLSVISSPVLIKKIIGDRLKENASYKKIIEEKPRCWRLNYADEFHLDITPSIPNLHCNNGGELVPDKKLKAWKASNPKGYRDWFNSIAEKQPTMAFFEDVELAEARAHVEEFPTPLFFKGLLKRFVQVCKRHRDTYFKEDLKHEAPISIIITTLLAKSYDDCVQRNIYNNDFDLLLDVVRHMPEYIERQVGMQVGYFVWNPTTAGENFAEKWNANPALAGAFYSWHKSLRQGVEQLLASIGLDQVRRTLSSSFGDGLATRVMDSITQDVSSSRQISGLSIAPGVGLAIRNDSSGNVTPNTFFGR